MNSSVFDEDRKHFFLSLASKRAAHLQDMEPQELFADDQAMTSDVCLTPLCLAMLCIHTFN